MVWISSICQIQLISLRIRRISEFVLEDLQHQLETQKLPSGFPIMKECQDQINQLKKIRSWRYEIIK